MGNSGVFDPCCNGPKTHELSKVWQRNSKICKTLSQNLMIKLSVSPVLPVSPEFQMCESGSSPEKQVHDQNETHNMRRRDYNSKIWRMLV
jgi:hypothetical protein